MARKKRVIPEVINDVEILKQWIPRLASGEIEIEVHADSNGEFDEDTWLAARKKGLGGSDIAGILGLLSKWTTPLKVWRQKMCLEPDTEPNWQMALGTENESLIAGVWAEKQGCRLIKIPFLRDVKNPHRAASVDFLAVFPDGHVEVIEVKWSKGMDDVPDYYFTQVTWYMAITGIHTGRLVSGGDRNEPDDGLPVPWDDSLAADIVATADEWWKKYIDGNIAPDPLTSDEIKSESASRIHDLIGERVDADVTANEIASRLLVVRKQIADLEEKKDSIEAELAKHMVKMGAAKVKGDGWTASFIEKKGGIHYGEIVKAMKLPVEELEKHRGNSCRFLSVRGKGEKE